MSPYSKATEIQTHLLYENTYICQEIWQHNEYGLLNWPYYFKMHYIWHWCASQSKTTILAWTSCICQRFSLQTALQVVLGHASIVWLRAMLHVTAKRKACPQSKCENGALVYYQTDKAVQHLMYILVPLLDKGKIEEPCVGMTLELEGLYLLGHNLVVLIMSCVPSKQSKCPVVVLSIFRSLAVPTSGSLIKHGRGNFPMFGASA
jgi:hypothetical protein